MINTREIAEEYRLSHWSKIMQERTSSGLSIRAYCESRGIRPNVYHYWQKKLREVAVMTTAVQPDCAPMPPGWAICETTKPTPEQKIIQIEIGKSRITAHAGTDQELLAKICRTLMSIC